MIASQEKNAGLALDRVPDVFQGSAECSGLITPTVMPDPDRRCPGFGGGNDLLGDLRGIPENEFPSGQGNPVDAAEGSAQIDSGVNIVGTGEGTSELLSEVPHQVNVRSGEPEDRLPVIPDRKDAGFRVLLLQRQEEARPAGRDVLEFIDKQVAIGAAVTTGLQMLGRTDNHVLKVDPIPEPFLVGLVCRLEYLQECEAPLLVCGSLGTLSALLHRDPGTLEVAQERSQRLGEFIDLAEFEQPVEHVLRQNRIGSCVGFQLLLKRRCEAPLDLFVAEGFDELGAVFPVDLPFPLHVSEIFLPVHVGSGGQNDLPVRSAQLPDTEMLNVDSGLGQSEVRRVGPSVVSGQVMFVGRLVFVCDAVQV